MSDEPDKPSDSQPRIIVDDDWKEEVRKEQEQHRLEEAPQAESDSTPDSTRSEIPASDAARSDHEPQPNADETRASEEASEPMPEALDSGPEASFELLIVMLAQKAMAGLGLTPDEQGQTTTPQPELARHFIDTLGILEKKTDGNRTAEETTLLSQVLHDLRMAFVHVRNG